jgi:hypothetical protein
MNTISWTEEEHPEHPTPEGVSRFVIERHWHTVSDDPADQFVTIAAAAVFRDAFGPCVELGSWSMDPAAARALADSLRLLADTAGEVSS